MKRKALALRSETVRVLAGAELRLAAGGYMEDRTSGPPEYCPPASVGAPSCTGCVSINVACVPNTCETCTLWTF